MCLSFRLGPIDVNWKQSLFDGARESFFVFVVLFVSSKISLSKPVETQDTRTSWKSLKGERKTNRHHCYFMSQLEKFNPMTSSAPRQILLNSTTSSNHSSLSMNWIEVKIASNINQHFVGKHSERSGELPSLVLCVIWLDKNPTAQHKMSASIYFDVQILLWPKVELRVATTLTHLTELFFQLRA